MKAVCHWGIAEDVCVIVEKDEDLIYLGGEIQVPMTREQARKLARELLAAIDKCEAYENALKVAEELDRYGPNW